jgi:hypothetical protein
VINRVKGDEFVRYYRFVVLLGCALFPVILWGESTEIVSSDQPPPELAAIPHIMDGQAGEPHNMTGPSAWTTWRELVLSLSILVFGLATLLIQYLLLRNVTAHRTEEVAKTFIVTLIILGTLLLLASGFEDRTISPALGLFGTIAGYLLGKQGLGEGGSESASAKPNKRNKIQSEDIDQ